MKSRAFALLFGVCCACLPAFGQDTIVHFKGPAFAVSYSGAQLDVNIDGSPDCVFYSEPPVCTADPFFTSCEFPYEIASGANDFLASDFALCQPFGAWIGAVSPAGSDWTSGKPFTNPIPMTIYVSTSGGNANEPESSWLGSLGIQGIGFLGIRFHAVDGLHYGWVRVRLPAVATNQLSSEFAPVIMEWAYETRTDTPIRAGATGFRSDDFRVDFQIGDGGHVSGDSIGSGTVQLIGNTMRYELHLAGHYTTASLERPGHFKSKGKSELNLDRPLISTERGFTVFFGDATLSPSQVMQLRRGALYFVVGDGEVIGRIVPANL
jgi:hypothetical protein